ncbi:MAG: hypothetical protein ACQETL_02095 [Bacteroidota bacterium]
MEAYRYLTKISDKGTITILDKPSLFGQEVELIIIPKEKQTKSKKKSAEQFLEKWSGFLSIEDPEKEKADYLEEKYK